MTPEQLKSLAGAVYGAKWQSALARDMGINVRTVQRWASAGIDREAIAHNVRRFLDERRIARIPGPPANTCPDDDRDDAVYDALSPAIQAVVAAAHDAGWSTHEAEFGALNISIDLIRASAGIPATIEILREAIRLMQGMRDT